MGDLRHVAKKIKKSRPALMMIVLCAVLMGTTAIGFAAYRDSHAKTEKEMAAKVITNDAGGQIDDIDWETIIGYDADSNPIYASFGKIPGVLGYDMFGSPIYSMTQSGVAQDGLPIFGDYSSVDRAIERGMSNALDNADVNWQKIVGYDADGNPIYASISENTNIIGYDATGRPIYKTEVNYTGNTLNGLPVYDFSTIQIIKSKGQEDAKDLQERMDNMQVQLDEKTEEINLRLAEIANNLNTLRNSSDTDQGDMDARKAEINNLANQLASLSGQVEALLSETGFKDERLKAMQEEADRLKNLLASSGSEMDTLKGVVATTQSDLNNAKDALSDTQSNVDALVSQVNAKDAQIADLKARMGENSDDLSILNQRITTVDGKADDAAAAAEAARLAAEQARSNITVVYDGASQTIKMAGQQ